MDAVESLLPNHTHLTWKLFKAGHTQSRATHMFSQPKLCYRGTFEYHSWDISLHTQLVPALSSWHSRGDEFSLPSELPSFPLKSLVADSNNKLQSDQSIVDQLEPLKSLRMRGWGKINLQFTSGWWVLKTLRKRQLWGSKYNYILASAEQ